MTTWKGPRHKSVDESFFVFFLKKEIYIYIHIYTHTHIYIYTIFAVVFLVAVLFKKIDAFTLVSPLISISGKLKEMWVSLVLISKVVSKCG